MATESNFKPITVSLCDLRNNEVPFSVLEEAFGPSSLGILLVKDLDSEFEVLRRQVLSYSSYLANLPKQSLENLESPEAKYLVGWSRGKEKLVNGHYDTLKGSYYVNCSFYNIPSKDTTEATLAKFPSFQEYTAENVWPLEEVLPSFQARFEKLCTLIIDAAVLVAQACDRYAEQNIANYTPGYLAHVVKTSHTTKARLLHYFPPADSEIAAEPPKLQRADEDDWCGEHLDHGCLTGLTSAMFVDENANPPRISPNIVPRALDELAASPDPATGLYIRSRTGDSVKVAIPRDCLAFQTGEALEVITEGQFRAVRHYVKGPSARSGNSQVARNTLAVFTQPNLDAMVDENRSFAEFAKAIIDRNTMT